jgi:hypothetical protein
MFKHAVVSIADLGICLFLLEQVGEDKHSYSFRYLMTHFRWYDMQKMLKI